MQLVSCLYESLVTSDTAALAAECLCGLINNCVPRRDGDGGENSLSGYHSDSSSSSSMLLLSDAPPGGGVPPGFNGWRRGGGTVGTTVGTTGSATIASNWSEAGFRRSRGMGGGPGGAPSRGSSGAHQRIASPLATAAAAAAGHSSGNGMLGMAGLAAGAGLSVQGVLALSPERQLAATLLLQRLLDGLQGLLQSAAVVYRQQYQVCGGCEAARFVLSVLLVLHLSGHASDAYAHIPALTHPAHFVWLVPVHPPSTISQAGLVSPQPGVAPDSDTAFWCLWTDGAVLQVSSRGNLPTRCKVARGAAPSPLLQRCGAARTTLFDIYHLSAYPLMLLTAYRPSAACFAPPRARCCRRRCAGTWHCRAVLRCCGRS